MIRASRVFAPVGGMDDIWIVREPVVDAVCVAFEVEQTKLM
jgi:hypothetical protein